MKEGITDEIITLVVQTIKDLVISGEEEYDKLSSILKEDIISASEKGDIHFINKVIVPILHAEDKVPLTISIDERRGRSKTLSPIFVGTNDT